MLPSLRASIKSEHLEASSLWMSGQTAMPTEFWLYITYDAGDSFYVRLPPLAYPPRTHSVACHAPRMRREFAESVLVSTAGLAAARA